MPTKNPRLTITMQPTLAAQLRRLSELTGNSQAALISELLEGSGPVFARLIRVLEAAQGASAAIKGSIGNDLRQAQERLEKQLGLSLEVLDDAAPLLEGVEAVKRRGRRKVAAGVPATSSTPMSNRGVRSTRKTGTSPNEKQGGKHGSI